MIVLQVLQVTVLTGLVSAFVGEGDRLAGQRRRWAVDEGEQCSELVNENHDGVQPARSASCSASSAKASFRVPSVAIRSR